MCVCACIIIVHFILLQSQKKQVFADLNELAKEIQGVLMNHLVTLNVSSKSGISKIEEQVK